MSVGHRDVVFPLLPGSLRELRQWARAWLGRHPTGVDPDVVLLAMTEAVTNSVRHGSPPVSVDLMDEAPHLWMQVNDGSGVLPRNYGPGVGQEGGRGLDIIGAV